MTNPQSAQGDDTWSDYMAEGNRQAREDLAAMLKDAKPAQGDGGRWGKWKHYGIGGFIRYRNNEDYSAQASQALTLDYLNALEDRNRELEAERDELKANWLNAIQRAERAEDAGVTLSLKLGKAEAEAARWRGLAERYETALQVIERVSMVNSLQAITAREAMKESGQ